MRILDIHTHKPAPRPEAVVAVSPESFLPLEGQAYSVGIHPWDTVSEISPDLWLRLENACGDSQVLAVGECGIDLLKGGPLFRQMQVFRRQAELAESLCKPLVIHCVRAHDIVIGIKKELKPRQNWVIHGFRGKPTVARMLLDAGMWLSFGPRFNPDSLEVTPLDRILAETDDSDLSIDDVIGLMSESKETLSPETIAGNAAVFFTPSRCG